VDRRAQVELKWERVYAPAFSLRSISIDAQYQGSHMNVFLGFRV